MKSLEPRAVFGRICKRHANYTLNFITRLPTVVQLWKRNHMSMISLLRFSPVLPRVSICPNDYIDDMKFHVKIGMPLPHETAVLTWTHNL